MEIRPEGIGKRFGRDWIFRNFDTAIAAGEKIAILGRNGSGKSTLLQIIAGNLSPTEGKISWHHAGQEIPVQNLFRQLSLVAPYQELIEEFTLDEMIRFHFKFKPASPGKSTAEMSTLLNFRVPSSKPLRQFSSGMKQRVKILLALMSDVPLLLLDEPAMNLDSAGIDWYHEMIRCYAAEKTVVVCSNMQQTEAGFVNRMINISEFRDTR